MPLTLKQCAVELGVTPRTARKYLGDWAFRVGRNWRFADDAPAQFKARHTAKPKPRSEVPNRSDDAETRLAKVFPSSPLLTP